MHEVRVVCTDKGTHPSRELGMFHLYDDPGEREWMIEAVGVDRGTAQYEYERLTAVANRATARQRKAWSRTTERGGSTVFPDRKTHDAATSKRPDFNTTMRDQVGAQTWRFRCPTCRRDVQLGRPVVLPLIERLAAAGVSRLDVSHLPV